VPDGKRANIVELIALRNIVVHSRGLVDERYLAVVPESTFKIGQKRELDIEDLISAYDLLDSVVAITDNAITGKFGLEQVRTHDEFDKRSAQRWPQPAAEAKKELEPASIAQPVPSPPTTKH